jgi:hypothetical protein
LALRTDTRNASIQENVGPVFPFASISLKSDLNVIAIGCFCDIIPLLTENENEIFLFMRKEDMIKHKQCSAEP